MKKQYISRSPRYETPSAGTLFAAQQNVDDERATIYRRYMDTTIQASTLLRYPIDTSPHLSLSHNTLDTSGVLCTKTIDAPLETYHPIAIAQFALAHWNAYLTNDEKKHQEAFLAQASWLRDQAHYFSNNTCGWLIPSTIHVDHPPQLVLSALAQGYGISTLVRAYQLTADETFLQTVQQAAHTFALDILDGGVNTPIGDNGIFFETVAVYPAQHTLCGHILALIGLYEILAVASDDKAEALIQRGLAALSTLIDEFDTGYWTYYDLFRHRLAHKFYHSLHILLLKVLAEYSGCGYYTELSARWQSYQDCPRNRLHYLITSRVTAFYDDTLKHMLDRFIPRTAHPSDPDQTNLNQICAPITAFPIPGGMRSVLACVAQVMQHQWHITYLTNYKGQDSGTLEIEVFGHKKVTSPWHFPTVWLYCFTGGWKLFKLLRQRSGFRLILPQDGIYSAAFSALVGKIMGIRVVCMDHGNITCFINSAFRKEEAMTMKTYPLYRRILAPIQSACYWPSLRLFARIANPLIDHFLVAGDEVEEVYHKRLGIHSSRITRYAYMVDTNRFRPPDRKTRVRMREKQGISEDAIVITLINRLDLPKGLFFALEGIALAQAELSPEVRKRLKVIIAGDGPLRSQIETDIQQRKLDTVCTLWGEAKPSDVVMLLGITDIFLYSGTRGTNYSMAVLEAMAAGCAVIASVRPQSNAKLLAEERGMAIMPGNAYEISTAITHLSNNLELCHLMGMKAREYVATYHTAEALRRNLLRTSFFVPQYKPSCSQQNTKPKIH